MMQSFLSLEILFLTLIPVEYVNFLSNKAMIFLLFARPRGEGGLGTPNVLNWVLMKNA